MHHHITLLKLTLPCLQVLLLTDCGLAAARPQGSALQPLKFTNKPHCWWCTCLDFLIPQVLLLSDYGLAAARPQGSALQPLKLTDTDPLLVHLAAESSAYWRGLELLSSSQLLSPQASCDVVLQPDRDHAGAEGFSKLQVCVGKHVLKLVLSMLGTLLVLLVVAYTAC